MTDGDTRRRKGWWASNWVWVVPVGCFGLVVVVVLMIAGLVGAVFGSLRSSWACEHGLELARGNPAVVEALGAPIDAGFWVSGSVSVSGPDGHADLAIPLHGSKGTGTLHVRATRKDGTWSFDDAEVAVEGRAERIHLLGGTSAPPLEVRGGRVKSPGRGVVEVGREEPS